MIPRLLVFLPFLYLAVTQTRSEASSKEDLQDEYYTIGATCIGKFQPSDERDAQAIVDSKKDNAIMAGIFPYREKIRRNAISEQIWIKSQKVMNETTNNKERARLLSEFWITKFHKPLYQKYFTDFLYSLIFDENEVLSAYLRSAFGNREETLINIILVLTKDMQALVNTYGSHSFKKDRKWQENPFENMLRVWVRQNRESLEKNELNPEDVRLNAEALKKEQENGGWHENRDQLELITMKKSIKFARAVIAEFEKLNGGKPLENILTENIKNCDLKDDLADTYGSLVRYIKNKPKYIAQIMSDYCTLSNQWAVWFLCIAVVHPQEWPKIDEAFKKIRNGTSLSEFIMKIIHIEKILAEAIAATVDPNFKPTTFRKRPMDNSPISPSPVPPTSP